MQSCSEWYALQVYQRLEKITALPLNQKGFDQAALVGPRESRRAKAVSRVLVLPTRPARAVAARANDSRRKLYRRGG